jgi:hypothetical protein
VTEGSCGFIESIRATAVIVPSIGPSPLPSGSFPKSNSSVILPLSPL